MASIAQIKEPETEAPKKEDESENLPVNKEWNKWTWLYTDQLIMNQHIKDTHTVAAPDYKAHLTKPPQLLTCATSIKLNTTATYFRAKH